MNDIDIVVDLLQWAPRVVIDHPIISGLTAFNLYRWIRSGDGHHRELAMLCFVAPALFLFAGEVAAFLKTFSIVTVQLGMPVAFDSLVSAYDILRLPFFASAIGGQYYLIKATSIRGTPETRARRSVFVRRPVILIGALASGLFIAAGFWFKLTMVAAMDEATEPDQSLVEKEEHRQAEQGESSRPTADVVRESIRAVTISQSSGTSSTAIAPDLPADLRFRWNSNDFGWEPTFLRFSRNGTMLSSNPNLVFDSSNYAPSPQVEAPNGDILLIHRDVLAAISGMLSEKADLTAPVIHVSSNERGVELALTSATGRSVDRLIVQPEL